GGGAARKSARPRTSRGWGWCSRASAISVTSRDGPMSPPQPERIYGVRELTRILTLTPKRAGQLRRLELLRGDSGYTFRDLLALRAASALLDAGASVRQIRAALTALRRQDPDLQQP